MFALRAETLESAPLPSSPGVVCLGVHYELLARSGAVHDYLLGLCASRRVILVADEVQALLNPKAGHTKFLLKLTRAAGIQYRWGLSGTPQRNRPMDLWAVFDFLLPDSMGSKSKYGIRYADGHEGTYGWEFKGITNDRELHLRLSSMMHRVLRSDVAQHLPPADRRIVKLDLTKAQSAEYKKLETILTSTNAEDPTTMLRSVLQRVTLWKFAGLEERLAAAENEKLLVFCMYHESLEKAEAHIAAKCPGRPLFCAGGWLTADKRRAAIKAWSATTNGVLFANIISSGVGIDLSAAAKTIFLEACWVPSDVLQAESRAVSVHNGKVAPTLIEFLVARGTVDEAMGAKLISKLSMIQRVVGKDIEASNLKRDLLEAGLVDDARVSLDDPNDEGLVASVLADLRQKLLDGMSSGSDDDSDNNREVDDGVDDEDEAEENEL
jgi:SNF2 family DNA or RNA helicase